MPNELREQIARRLRAASCGMAQVRCDEMWPSISDRWLRAADECLRLMEWARSSTPQAQEHYRLKGERLPLTLPPDDWRPEKEGEK